MKIRVKTLRAIIKESLQVDPSIFMIKQQINIAVINGIAQTLKQSSVNLEGREHEIIEEMTPELHATIAKLAQLASLDAMKIAKKYSSPPPPIAPGE